MPKVGAARVALVIGNSSYAPNSLRNPGNDAKAMAERLTSLDFEVDLRLDASREEMKRGIKQFKERLRATQALGLFFFSGHGLQVDGRNFLVPVDAQVHDPEEVEYQTVSADEVLASMEAARTGINIVFLDACRDSPFPDASRGTGPARGLALMNAPGGTLLAYSTAPGKTASDGTGAYGTWTGALLEHIDAKGLQVEQVLKRTAAAVRERSAGTQTPWLATNWYGDIYLNPNQPASAGELLRLARENYAAGDYLSVIEDVQQALESQFEPLSAHERELARQLSDQAQAQLAELRFSVDPQTATVRVDGSTRYSKDGVMALNPGEHELEVSEQGYQPVKRSVDLNPGSHERLDLKLKPLRLGPDRRWLPIGLGGAAAASLVVSVTTWGLSVKSANQLEKHCDENDRCHDSDSFDWSAEQEKGKRMALTGDIFLGVGLAAAASALLVHYWPRLFDKKGEDRVLDHAEIWCGREGCSARGRIRF